MATAFVNSKTPPHHRSNSLAQDAIWLTWSPAFKKFIRELKTSGSINRRIKMVEVPECKPYGKTYTTNLHKLHSHEQSALLHFAEDLLRYEPKKKASCFHGMMEPLLNRRELRSLFTLLREAFIHILGRPSQALYSPVTPERRDPGFNLHADLFLTNRLWLVFDDVPNDGTGSTLLVSKKDLLAIVKKHKKIPDKIIADLSDIMSRTLTRDAYNYCWSIVHGPSRPWHKSLNEQLQEAAYNMAFKTGEGYLIDDRQWLHGRTAVSISVTASRFHRLTF